MVSAMITLSVSLSSSSLVSLCSVIRLHLSGAQLLGRLLALPTNISWEGLPGINTLAYYEDYIIEQVTWNKSI